jgi:hypothetical protein
MEEGLLQAGCADLEQQLKMEPLLPIKTGVGSPTLLLCLNFQKLCMKVIPFDGWPGLSLEGASVILQSLGILAPMPQGDALEDALLKVK